MRIPKVFVAATLVIGSARTALANQAAVKVDLSVPASHTVWYADPVWIGIGAVALLIIIVLAIMASRSGDAKTTTTVIR